MVPEGDVVRPGFGETRILTEYYLDLAKDLAWQAMEYNAITWEGTVRGAIDPSAGHLVRAGYTPSWLKEIDNTPEPTVWPIYQ